METSIKLFAVLLVCGLVASVSAAPVINPSVQTRPIVCRYWLTSWLCSDTGNSGGGTYQVVMDTSTESTVNIWNFTTDLMNWTSTSTNIYYGQGMNQTPNMTAGPPGSNGSDGDDATIAIGSVTTLDAGESATVENVGTPSAAIFDFGIPMGPQGDQGVPGAANMTAGPPGEQGLQGPAGPANMTAGPAGAAATIDVNATFSGTPASVTNIGTTAAALLDFVIPPGAKGDKGDQGINGTPGAPGSNGSNGSNGAAATIAVNNTVTLAAGNSATVTNVGSTSAASLDFGIPAGAKGDKGEKGEKGDANAYNASYDVLIRTDYVYTGNTSYWQGTNYNASYWTGTNYNASYLTSTYNSTYDAKTNYNASYANKTQYAYLTLMAGSAMIPTTGPPSNFDQQETTTNKNNFIFANISNATGQNVQWIVDMPADWDDGNIIANFLWSVQSGSGDVNWTLNGLRFDNDAAIDAALPLIAFKVDTVITAGDLHVSDATTAAAITGTGNVVIFKVGRSTTSDTLAATPGQLIGVRIKYAKVIGAT